MMACAERITAARAPDIPRTKGESAMAEVLPAQMHTEDMQKKTVEQYAVLHHCTRHQR